MKMILFEMMKFIIMLIPMLMSMAYLTLSESKMLGYCQASKGPNVVGVYGLLQPLADGVKLFSKEIVIPNHVSMMFYFFAPLLALTLSILMWSIIPLGNYSIMYDMNINILIFFCMSSINVYAILMSGWSSNSKYAFLGALSAAAQMISYEVSMGLMMFSVILCSGSLNLFTIIKAQTHCLWFIMFLWPISMMFFISCLAETNSSPFDLTEGESEMVSGYNVEYSAMSFALFFLAEYSHIMFMSTLFTIIFTGGWNMFFMNCNMILWLKTTMMVFLFMWISASFPSLSYDQLMNLLWKSYLPLSLGFMMIANSLMWVFQALPPKLCI